MVDVVGHFGMALLWLAPVWYFVDHRQTAALIVATGFLVRHAAGRRPPLSNWGLGLHHHGVVHTVLAVTIFAAVLGPSSDSSSDGSTTERAGSPRERARRPSDRLSHRLDPRSRAPLRRHALGPDVSTRIEPLWPLVKGPVVMMDVLWYQSWWATWGLLILGISVNALAWYWTDGRDESVDGAAVLTE